MQRKLFVIIYKIPSSTINYCLCINYVGVKYVKHLSHFNLVLNFLLHLSNLISYTFIIDIFSQDLFVYWTILGQVTFSKILP